MGRVDPHLPWMKIKNNDVLPQRKMLELDIGHVTEAYFNFQQQNIHLEMARAMEMFQSHDKKSAAGGPQKRFHDALMVTSFSWKLAPWCPFFEARSRHPSWSFAKVTC